MATFTNQATLSYRGNVVNSNIVTGEIVEVLSVTKDSLSDTYAPNGDAVYVVNFINSGTTQLNNLSFVDDLGRYNSPAGEVTPLSFVDGSLAYFVNGVLQADPVIVNTNPLTLTGISLPADSVGTLVYRADVNEYALLEVGSTIVNTATFSGGGLAQPVSDTATITVTNAPRLDIAKALSPAVSGPEGEITYTLTILNYGNTETVVGDSVVVNDTFNPILNPITVTYNGTAWTEGVEYTYNPTTGEFSTVAGAVVVPAATYTQDPVTGVVNVLPGRAVITVTGNIVG